MYIYIYICIYTYLDILSKTSEVRSKSLLATVQTSLQEWWKWVWIAMFLHKRVGCCPKFHNSCLSRCFKRTHSRCLTESLINCTSLLRLRFYFYSLDMDTLDPMRQSWLALVALTTLPTAPEISLFGKDEEEEEKNEEAQLATLDREGGCLEVESLSV